MQALANRPWNPALRLPSTSAGQPPGPQRAAGRSRRSSSCVHAFFPLSRLRGGMGWGVVQYGTAVLHLLTPIPSPQGPQGGGDEFAALANRIFGACRDNPTTADHTN